MHDVLNQISKVGIVPVIKIDDVEKAVPLAKALVAGGIPCAEVTFRTAEGEEAIRRIAAEVPEVILGAGTVLTTAQVDKAIAAGAKFIVSPGFNPKIVSYCIEKGIPITPGCSTPSDIEKALEHGLEVVKFFPAEQAGGINFIKAVAAPYTTVKFMPTGGINANNVSSYLAFDRVLACGGSWMVGADLIAEGNFDEITRLAREAVLSMLDFKLIHIGLNTDNTDAALQAAKMFEMLFGFKVKDGSKSAFAGPAIEVMKSPGPGKHGHIAIATNSVMRAHAFLERQGIQFDDSTIRTDAKGKMTFIYLKEEIAGFAVHLLQR